jgi:cytochrome c551/c552
MAEIPERDPNAAEAEDPIVKSSMSGPILISTLLVMITMGWALWDEVYGQRPWKQYQEMFVARYDYYLSRTKSREAKDAEEEIKNSPEYQKLDAEFTAEDEKVKQRRQEIDQEVALIDLQTTAINNVFQLVRGETNVKTYEAEVASSQSKRDSLVKEVEEMKKEKQELNYPVDRNGKVEERNLDYHELEALFNERKDRKTALLGERIELTKAADEARQRRDTYLQEHIVDLTPAQIEGLKTRLNNFDYRIRQLNIVGAGDMVDRCESCHLGVREPIRLTRTAMGGRSRDPEMKAMSAAFTSHTNPELLRIHNPEKFGCSTCHNGNGRATTSVQKAHGNYKHWLWPLYKRENIEAGCVQCHTKDIVLDHAPTLNQGRDLFQQKGCYACHRYEGYDRDAEALFGTRQTIKQLESEKAENLRQSEIAKREADKTNDSDEARRLNARSQNLIVNNSKLDAKIEELDVKAKYAMWDRKTFGPNLKELRYKVRKEWVPVWLKDPHAWRPGTKMPKFRLDDEEIKALSTFLWQSALQGLPALPAQAPGDAARGKTLFETRGCMACHSVGENGSRVGGDFAANLTRVGDKANYEYIVRWIHDPRQRLAPYSPTEKKDLLPEDYQKKGLPFAFDRNRSKSPNNGRELQWQNNSVMPNFRLSDQDTRDIATYLFSVRKNERFPDASFMDSTDRNVFERGKALARNYGCASCHEIRGLEDESRIGTELTVEGSKPIERLDFALLTHDAKKGEDPFTGEHGEKWYNHKGFFEKKLAQPDIYDKGKIKDKKDQLKMPKIAFGPNDERKKQEIDALTTFLLGSVESAVPASLRYTPTDQRQAIQEGWWVVRKYNCMGCHNIQIGQQTTLGTLPLFQTPEFKDHLPPKLMTEGARVQPDWLLRFLNDPSLTGANGTEGLDQNGRGNRNGVRKYMETRMPTFNFSPNELKLLVNFFMAVSSQSHPYLAEQLEPLTPQERTLAQTLFNHQAAPCLKCHITDDNNLKDKSAPNFLIAAERLKPEWTFRWLLDPQQISPGTGMPSGLFKRDPTNTRWIFSADVGDAFKDYDKDHARLLVRYMFQYGGGGGNKTLASARAREKLVARGSRSSPAVQAKLARRLVAASH